MPYRASPSSLLLFAVASTIACSSSPAEEDTSAVDGEVRSGGYDVNGHSLNANETKWLEAVAKDVLPRLPGTRQEQIKMAARGVWWTLKEGNWERGNAFAYNLCNTSSGDRKIGPLETCDDDPLGRAEMLRGRAWQVGIAGVQVPGRRIDKTEALAAQLYPGSSIESILEETASLAGHPPGSRESRAIVASSGPLRLSWLLRIPAVGFVDVVTKEVVPECITGSKGFCYGSSWDETRKFAPSKSAALRAIGDLEKILSKLAGSGESGSSSGSAAGTGEPETPPVSNGEADGNDAASGGGCWSPTLSEDVEELACVQSESNDVWYQCKNGDWYRGVTGTAGPYGSCASTHPL